MKNMTLPVKSSKLFLFALLLLFAACDKDPFSTEGKVEDPKWTVTVDNDMTSSMTAIVQVSFAENQGTLAAFVGDACCGVAEYVEGRYFLYIIGPQSENPVDISIRFYSPDLKRIFVAKETIPFVNDSSLGSVSEPLTFEWEVAKD